MEGAIIILLITAVIICSVVSMLIAIKHAYSKADTKIRRELLREINGLRIRTLRLEHPPKFAEGETVVIYNLTGDEVSAVVIGRWYDDIDVAPTYRCKTKDGFVDEVAERNMVKYVGKNTKTQKKK